MLLFLGIFYYSSLVIECRNVYAKRNMIIIDNNTHTCEHLQKYGDFDRSYFSLDCFHPGRKLHQSMAYSLWNNMVRDLCSVVVILLILFWA